MTEVRIRLPLPLDITGTLIQVIGMTYPGTVIKDGKGRWDSENDLVLDIPDTERHKSAKKAKKYEEVKTYLDGYADSLINELGPAGASFALPEYMMKLNVEMARGLFALPDAKNYVETTISDAENGARYLCTVARSEKQTPHAIAEKAKAELAALKLKLSIISEQLEVPGMDDGPVQVVVDELKKLSA